MQNKKDLGVAALGATNKMFWSEYHQHVMNLAIDVLGPEGQILTGDPTVEESVPGYGARRTSERYPSSVMQSSFFFSRSETIWGGTSQIQRNIVGERVLGLPKEPKVEAAEVAQPGSGDDRDPGPSPHYPRITPWLPRPSTTLDDRRRAPAPQPKAPRRRRTRMQRTILGVGVLVVLAILAGIAAVGYGYYRFNQINKEKLSLTKAGANKPQNYLIVGSDSRDAVDKSDPNYRAFVQQGRRRPGRSAPTRSSSCGSTPRTTRSTCCRCPATSGCRSPARVRASASTPPTAPTTGASG